MGALTQSCTTTSPKIRKAMFSGRNNITAVNRATGVATSLGGNYQFRVDVTDNSEPGSSPGAGPDTYAIKVWNSTTPRLAVAPPKAAGSGRCTQPGHSEPIEAVDVVERRGWSSSW